MHNATARVREVATHGHSFGRRSASAHIPGRVRPQKAARSSSSRSSESSSRSPSKRQCPCTARLTALSAFSRAPSVAGGGDRWWQSVAHSGAAMVVGHGRSDIIMRHQHQWGCASTRIAMGWNRTATHRHRCPRSEVSKEAGRGHHPLPQGGNRRVIPCR